MYQRIVVYTKNNKWRVGCIALIAGLLGAIALLIWFGVVTRWPTWTEFTALFRKEPVPVVATTEITPIPLEPTEEVVAVIPVDVPTQTPKPKPTVIVSYTAVATYTQVITRTDLVTYTVTPVPTSTPQPTVTDTTTPIPTDTSIPTWTPPPTYTPYVQQPLSPLTQSTQKPSVESSTSYQFESPLALPTVP